MDVAQEALDAAGVPPDVRDAALNEAKSYLDGLGSKVEHPHAGSWRPQKMTEDIEITEEMSLPIAKLISDFARGEYQEFCDLDISKRHNAVDVASVIEHYGYDLAEMGFDKIKGTRLIRVEDADDERYDFDIDLWDSSGVTDLTLSGFLIRNNEEWQVEVSTVRVMRVSRRSADRRPSPVPRRPRRRG